MLFLWKCMDLILRKSHLLRCWGCLSLLNWIGGSYIMSMLKLPPIKLEPWFILELSQPCMEYFCHAWTGTPSCYLELLDKLQKLICRTVGPSLAAFLELLAHRWNIASLSLFYRYFLVDVIGTGSTVSASLFSREVHWLLW